MLRNARTDAHGDIGRKLLRELARDCRSACRGRAVDALISLTLIAGGGVGKGAQHLGGCSGAFGGEKGVLEGKNGSTGDKNGAFGGRGNGDVLGGNGAFLGGNVEFGVKIGRK